jgi:hypothetical protein
MRLLRFTIGRWLMHLGLIVMPPGRGRRELHRMLMDWSLQVRAEIVRHGSAQYRRG